MRVKVLVTVKAYPAISKKYKETVCTAGLTEEGNWIRIYPIPFRLLDYENKFRKYEWVELDLERNMSDFRLESYRLKDLFLKDMVSHGIVKADGDTWAERRSIILKKVYTNFGTLFSEAKNKSIYTSLAVFKPTKIIDFVYKETKREWSKKRKIILSQRKFSMDYLIMMTNLT
jgi:hypothetical protein